MKHENLTFSALLDSFYIKAAEKGVELKPRLHFMLQISINIDKIKLKLKAPLKKLMHRTRKMKMLEKVPKDMIIDEENAYNYLRNKINAINNEQKDIIKTTLGKINRRIVFEPHTLKDDKFDEYYRQWECKPARKKHIQRVECSIKLMASEFQKLNEEFNEIMAEVNTARECLEELRIAVDHSFNKLLNSTKPKQAERIIISEIKPMLNIIHKQQKDLGEKLKFVTEILTDYNTQRLIWAQFLIGMRSKLPSQLIQVQPAEPELSVKDDRGNHASSPSQQ